MTTVTSRRAISEPIAARSAPDRSDPRPTMEAPPPIAESSDAPDSRRARASSVPEEAMPAGSDSRSTDHDSIPDGGASSGSASPAASRSAATQAEPPQGTKTAGRHAPTDNRDKGAAGTDSGPETRNLYIRARHLEIWRRAERFAEANDVSLSHIVVVALDAYLAGRAA